jgi:2-polyprenyl-3-methyl-5-hydroxy-6-metoxy-1,4-benzoquinol methylase
MELEFTGERVIPGKVTPDLYYEHISRYFFAKQLIKPHHHVIDLGCGAGYGTFELAHIADFIAGIDISYEAIEYAKERYTRPNLSFMQMDCSDLTFEHSKFDIAVSFEVIEHVPDVFLYMEQIKKVLKNDGAFIVSTPNKRMYTDPYDYSNPFHITEFYYNEFLQFLQAYFKHVTIFFQEYIQGIAIKSLTATDDVGHTALELGSTDPEATNYFIAVCSDADIGRMRDLHFTFKL